MDPRTLNKYHYIKTTPTWVVRTMYATGLVTWGLVVVGFVIGATHKPFYIYVTLPCVAFFTLYQLINFGLNLTYRQFNLEAHRGRVRRYWHFYTEPTVDIFLPICGEDINVLKNTWKHVALLDYKKIKVYVVDDSTKHAAAHKKLALAHGFTYLSRPNKGHMKKAGNLKFAHEHSTGEYIAIFDADFAPHPDFLYELLPYFKDESVAIVQSPQYFITNDETHQTSPLQYAAGYSEESFYRFIQTTRDRFGGTICCGSNALYRRSALDEIGGTVQVDHSEDAATGFELASRGWKIRYIPIILAVGLCPDNTYSYFHQQHRWCLGSMTLMLTKRFWTSPLRWQAKLCYIAGFLYYLHHPIVILFSFQLLWSVFTYGGSTSVLNGLFFYPHLLFSIIYLTLFPTVRFRASILYALTLQAYCYTHSILTTFLNGSVGWIPTNAKTYGVSSAFRQVTIGLVLYVSVYTSILLIALTNGFISPYIYTHYSIGLWLMYSLTLPYILLAQMLRTTLSSHIQICYRYIAFISSRYLGQEETNTYKHVNI